MTFLALVVVIALIGLVVGLAQAAPYIPGPFKQIVFWVGIICVIVLLLNVFGVFDLIASVQVPRFHGR